MLLIPQAVWLGATVTRRYEHIMSLGDVVVEASAVAITANAYDLALEWLEEGRSIVWNQLLKLRNPLEALCAVDASLANELQLVAHNLEHAASLEPHPHALLPTEHALEQTAQQHRRLAEQWEQLVAKARLLPGFEDFMRPRRASDLITAAQTGPVVVVNVHTSRCDALVLVPGSSDIKHVPLVSLSHSQVAEARTRLSHSLQSHGLIARGVTRQHTKQDDPFEETLAMLWSQVAQPVLDFLGYTVCALPHSRPSLTDRKRL